MAEETFLENKMGGQILDPVKEISQQHEKMSRKGLPKILVALKLDGLCVQSGEGPEGQSLRELSEQNKKTVDEATKMLMEQQREAHQQAVLQWSLKKISEQIGHQKSHWQEKEYEWAEKITQQKELSQQIEDKYKNVKQQDSRKLIELQNQLQEKQLKTEKHWSELTNTWVAEKVCRDNKIEELKRALERAKKQ